MSMLWFRSEMSPRKTYVFGIAAMFRGKKTGLELEPHQWTNPFDRLII